MVLDGRRVLLVLEQRAEERDVRLELRLADARTQQGRDPVDQLRGRGLLAQLALAAQPIELDQHLVEQRGVEVRMMDVDDPLHQLGLGEVDEVEHAAP
jgi:hypothetical protein